MNIHRTKFKREWDGWYPFKRILSAPFSFLVFPTPVSVLLEAVDKSRGFLPNLQVFWSFGIERSAYLTSHLEECISLSLSTINSPSGISMNLM